MSKRHGMTALTIGLVALVASTAHAAAPELYVLKHPKHEHCKTQYLEKSRTVKLHGHRVKQTVCVFVPPIPIPTPPGPCTPSPLETNIFLRADAHALGDAYRFDVEGTAYVPCGEALIGVPITYTLKNENTGQPLGSFTEPSDPVQPCTIVYRAEAKAQTFTGESVASLPACPLVSVSMPPGQIAELTASFAGDSAHAASSDSQTL